MVRLLTFAAVISVHTLAFTEQPDNRAVAGSGGAAPGSAGVGGAIANVALLGNAVLTVSHSTFSHNQAIWKSALSAGKRGST